MEYMLEAEAIWLISATLINDEAEEDFASKYRFPDLSNVPYYRNLIDSGTPGREAIEATNAALNDATRAIKEKLVGIQTVEGFEVATNAILAAYLESGLPIELVWNEEMGQPFMSTPLEPEWTSIWPPKLVFRRSEYNEQELGNWCESLDTIEKYLEVEGALSCRAVRIVDGEVSYFEESSLQSLVESLGR
jgi:hypothetical protein